MTDKDDIDLFIEMMEDRRKFTLPKKTIYMTTPRYPDSHFMDCAAYATASARHHDRRFPLRTQHCGD